MNKLYLLREKQHNLGQEGAGLGCINLNATPGHEYIFRERALGSGAIQEIFSNAKKQIASSQDSEEVPFLGEIYIGHLRYSTTGKSGISYVHPFLRRNNWRARNFMLCGHVNITIAAEIFYHIVNQGQTPRISPATLIFLEPIGYSSIQ